MDNEFRCKRCDYSTKYKHSLQKHLTKQKECNGQLCEISRENLLKELNELKKVKVCKCPNCDRIFRDRWVLERHISSCKVIALNELKEELEELRDFKEQVNREKETSTIINNNSNNNNNNTIINNNINITMNYSDDKDFLKGEILREIIKSDDEMSSLMFKALNFDVDHPENHNFIMLSLDSGKCLVYSDGKYIEIAVNGAIYQKLECHKRILLNRTIKYENKQNINYHYNGIQNNWSKGERDDGVYKMIKTAYENKNIIKNLDNIIKIITT